MAMKPTFFGTPKDFRRWLERNHDKADELLVGFWKRDSGKPSITWPESVDEALCFGWIDGVKKRVDESSYMHRFTPRKAGSIWSVVNTKRAKALVRLGLMAPPGLQAFERRDRKKTKRYSHEREKPAFDPAIECAFKANAQAWTFFRSQPPGYQRLLTFWIMTAKQDEARLRRLAALVKTSAEGKRMR
jgi:uncharacterized protein YdeI (YjbR/CyaY-like superfamily)